MALSFWHLGHPVPVNRLTVCPQEDTEDVPGTGGENLFGAEPRPCCASLMLSAPATLTGCRTLASEFLLPVLFHVGDTPILSTWHLIPLVPLHHILPWTVVFGYLSVSYSACEHLDCSVFLL